MFARNRESSGDSPRWKKRLRRGIGGELSGLPKNVRQESLTYAARAHTAGDRVMIMASKDALLPQLLSPP
jgi:hypothetical protein